MIGTGTAPDRKRHTDELVEAGALVPVRLEGHKPLVYAPAEDVPRLSVAREGEPDFAADPQVAFIAPLDPFIWDRQIVRDVFGFDYIWEVYVPEHKRRWGYYVLPILFGDRLVGRIEPRLERKTRHAAHPWHLVGGGLRAARRGRVRGRHARGAARVHGVRRRFLDRVGAGDGWSGRADRHSPPALNDARAYIRPMMWPSGSANRAIVVSGATSVSGMITRPPFASTLASAALASSQLT